MNIENFLSILDPDLLSQVRGNILEPCPFKHFFEINDVPVSTLRNLPFHLYWKDLDGNFLGSNDTQAKSIGFRSGENLLGLTDFDVAISSSADKIRNIDNEVIISQKMKFLHEQSILINGNIYNGWSYKWPIFSKKNKTLGISGITIGITWDNNRSILHEFKKDNSSQVTNREKDCLYYLAKGLTAKRIAENLNISQRTVEQHLCSAKNKMRCQSKEELIAKTWLLPDIKNMLLRDLTDY